MLLSSSETLFMNWCTVTRFTKRSGKPYPCEDKAGRQHCARWKRNGACRTDKTFIPRYKTAVGDRNLPVDFIQKSHLNTCFCLKRMIGICRVGICESKLLSRYIQLLFHPSSPIWNCIFKRFNKHSNLVFKPKCFKDRIGRLSNVHYLK